MPSTCCVKGCFNKQSFYGYSMFGFPNDPDMKSQWVEAVKTDTWEPKPHHRICEVHFEPALIYFVGSRKELKKTAVPTLFCNCTCLQSINEDQKKCTTKPNIFDGESLCRSTVLDHPYCQNLLVLSERFKKDTGCKDSRNGKASATRRKFWKHASDCNLVRRALTNTPKIKDNIFCNQRPIMPVKTLLIKHPGDVAFKVEDNEGNLKCQLKSALDENAKLKREVSRLKGLVIPRNLKTLNPKNIRIVRLEKIA